MRKEKDTYMCYLNIMSIMLYMTISSTGFSQEPTQEQKMYIVININSGRPNPVLILDKQDIKEINKIVEYINSSLEFDNEFEGHSIVPNNILGYRGIRIINKNMTSKLPNSIETYDNVILKKKQNVRAEEKGRLSLSRDSADTLEDYLINLALEKEVISEDMFFKILELKSLW